MRNGNRKTFTVRDTILTLPTLSLGYRKFLLSQITMWLASYEPPIFVLATGSMRIPRWALCWALSDRNHRERTRHYEGTKETANENDFAASLRSGHRSSLRTNECTIGIPLERLHERRPSTLHHTLHDTRHTNRNWNTIEPHLLLSNDNARPLKSFSLPIFVHRWFSFFPTKRHIPLFFPSFAWSRAMTLLCSSFVWLHGSGVSLFSLFSWIPSIFLTPPPPKPLTSSSH